VYEIQEDRDVYLPYHCLPESHRIYSDSQNHPRLHGSYMRDVRTHLSNVFREAVPDQCCATTLENTALLLENFLNCVT